MTLRRSSGRATAVAGLLAASAAQAQIVAPVEIDDLNLIGIAVGSAPDFMGSSDTTGAAAPLFRYQFSGSERYVAVIGPSIYLNVLDDKAWRFGLVANLRLGRDSDVDDAVVSQMEEIDDEWEGGVFLQYNYALSDVTLHKLAFAIDVTGGDNGTVVNPRLMWWQPLNDRTVFNIGVGLTWANDKWMNTYFGIEKTQDIALFGESYEAGSGLKSFSIPIGISYRASKEWLLSLGARFEWLSGDAKDSPIVQERGDENQFIVGAGISYTF